MTRLTRLLSALALTLVGVSALTASASAQTSDPAGGALVVPPGFDPSAGTSFWQYAAVAVCTSLVTIAVVLMAQRVGAHRHHGIARAA